MKMENVLAVISSSLGKVSLLGPASKSSLPETPGPLQRVAVSFRRTRIFCRKGAVGFLGKFLSLSKIQFSF